MNVIAFPGLNLKFNVSKIALSVGNLSIYWYAVLIVFAFVISLIIFKLKDGKFGVKFNSIIDLALLAIPISIISARIYYILFNLEYYMSNPKQIINLRSGGLAIYGGVIGGAIACYAFCKKKKINLLDIFDYIVPCLALRTINRKMGELYKSRSIWIRNKASMENGNI